MMENLISKQITKKARMVYGKIFKVEVVEDRIEVEIESHLEKATKLHHARESKLVKEIRSFNINEYDVRKVTDIEYLSKKLELSIMHQNSTTGFTNECFSRVVSELLDRINILKGIKKCDELGMPTLESNSV